MPFMEKEVTIKSNWIMVDGDMGTEYIEDDLIKHSLKLNESLTPESDQFDDIVEAISDYIENRPGRIYTIELISGYGARLSAPGYMDRTEWSVHDTEAEAIDYLDNMYDDEYSKDEEDEIA